MYGYNAWHNGDLIQVTSCKCKCTYTCTYIKQKYLNQQTNQPTERKTTWGQRIGKSLALRFCAFFSVLPLLYFADTLSLSFPSPFSDDKKNLSKTKPDSVWWCSSKEKSKLWGHHCLNRMCLPPPNTHLDVMLRRAPSRLLCAAAGPTSLTTCATLIFLFCAKSDTLVHPLEAELSGDAGVTGSPARHTYRQRQTSVPALQKQTRSTHPSFSLGKHYPRMQESGSLHPWPLVIWCQEMWTRIKK